MPTRTTIIALVLIAAACGDSAAPTTGAPPPVATSTPTIPATSTTAPPATTLPPTTVPPTTAPGPIVDWEAIAAARWLVHGIDGIATDGGTIVWTTDPVLGADNLARDGAGGFVWIDAGGLWWLPKDAPQPRPVPLPQEGAELTDVILGTGGPVARLGWADAVYVDMATGDEVTAPTDAHVDYGDESLRWTAANGLVAELTPPEVVLDDEGQPTEVREPARLTVWRGSERLVDLAVGGIYESWARLHDFDGRRLIVSRGPFEPALPLETYFVVDLADADHVDVFAADAAHAVLVGLDIAEPVDVVAPKARILTAARIATDESVVTLPDGVYVVFPDGSAATPASLAVDLAVWFSGEEANRAAREDGHNDIPVPNDYYIRNRDTATITLPVADDVAVTSVWFDYEADQDLEADPIDYADFLAVMTGDGEDARVNMRFDPWWITVEDGRIVALDEQYIP